MKKHSLRLVVFLCALCSSFGQPIEEPYTFSVFAGKDGAQGVDDGPGESARFFYARGLALDAANNLYVADAMAVRKVTTDGVVSTFAAHPAFNTLMGITVDSDGIVYTANHDTPAIQKITPAGVVSTVGTGFRAPFGVTRALNGSLLVTDFGGTIYEIPTSGPMRPLASVDTNGMPFAMGDYPYGIVTTASDDLFVVSSSRHQVVKMNLEGEVSVFAGGGAGYRDGPRESSAFWMPTDLAIDSTGNLFVLDFGNKAVRKITPEGSVTTIGHFDQPNAVAVDSAGAVYVCEKFVIRRGFKPVGPPRVHTQPKSQRVSAAYPVAFEAIVNGEAPLSYQWRKEGVDLPGPARSSVLSIANAGLDSAGVYSLFVTNRLGETTSSNAILEVEISYRFTTVAGTKSVLGLRDGAAAEALFNYPLDLAVGSDNDVYVADTSNRAIRKITPDGGVSTLATDILHPTHLAVDRGGSVFVADSAQKVIWKVSPSGAADIIAGTKNLGGSTDGVGSAARFGNPAGIVVDSAGNLFVADTAYHTIRKITPALEVTTFMGEPGVSGRIDGSREVARFRSPTYLAIDTEDNLYVVDSSPDGLVRKISPGRIASTVPFVKGALSVATAPGGTLYVTIGRSIAKITPGRPPMTIGGLPGAVGQTVDGEGFEARFNIPTGMSVNSAGALYIAETRDCVIRKGVFPDWLEFQAPSYAINETNASVEVRVGLGMPRTDPVSVKYSTRGGTATSGEDFTPAEGTLTFAPGEILKTITLSIINDGLIENDETIEIKLSDPVGAPLGEITSTIVTIINNDRLTFIPSSPASVMEGGGPVSIDITRSGEVATANYFTRDLSARAGVDYGAAQGPLVFALDETNKTITIEIFNDARLNGSRDFLLKTVSGTWTNDLVIAIVDNDWLYLDGPYEVAENGRLEIPLRYGGEIRNAHLSTQDDTARAGIDYEPRSIDLSLAPGEHTLLINIPLIDNGVVDGNRSFYVNLAAPGDPTFRQLFVIVDNEEALTRDESFRSPFLEGSEFGGSYISAFCLQPDGKILVGGYLALPDARTLSVARLNPDGSMDPSFAPLPYSGWIMQVRLLSDGRILIVGDFPREGLNMALQRLNADGSIDSTFNAFAGIASTQPIPGTPQFPDPFWPQIYDTVIQSDGKILIGGLFDHVNDVGATNLARLNADGSLDGTFAASTGMAVSRTIAEPPNIAWEPAFIVSLAVQPDGRILAGGNFAEVNGSAHPGLIRLRSDGSVDDDFRIGAGALRPDGPGSIHSILVNGDGSLYIAGTFTSVNSVDRLRLARLRNDGSVDTAFEQKNFSYIHGIAARAASLYISGYTEGLFEQYFGDFVVRLNVDGSVDRTFLPQTGSPIPSSALVIEATGNVLRGGAELARFFADANRPRVGLRVDFPDPFKPYVLESDNEFRIEVNRFGPSLEQLSVNFETRDGTALAGRDFNDMSAILSFAPLETTKTIAIPVYSNPSLNDHTFHLLLTSPTGGADLAVNTLDVVIRNTTLGLRVGTEGFTLAGPPGASIIVELSSDLTSWSEITGAFAGFFLRFADISADSYLFFRARLE